MRKGGKKKGVTRLVKGRVDLWVGVYHVELIE